MAKKISPKQTTTKKHVARRQREARQTRILLIIVIVIGVIILGLLGYGIVDQLIIKPRIPVAEVDATVIRLKEFQIQVQYARAQSLNQLYQNYMYGQQFGEYGASFLDSARLIAMNLSDTVGFGRGVLDEMIDWVLIRKAAKEHGITVSEEEIENTLQQAFGFFPEGTLTPTTTATAIATPTLSETQRALVTLTNTPTAADLSSEELELSPAPVDELDAENHEENTETLPDTNEDYPGELETETTTEENASTPTPQSSPTITPTPTVYTTKIFGENLKEFNKSYSLYKFNDDDLRNIIEIELLRDKLIEKIITDVTPFKEEVWARHILVDTEEEALDVLEQLNDGGDFHLLASEHSTDESNKDNGGDLGWFNDSMMVEEFSKTAFSLDVGEISDPVQTSFGYHIIQVLGKRDTPLSDYELQQSKQEAFSKWLGEQRETNAEIIYHDGWEAYVPTKPEVPQQLLTELYY